MPSKIINLCYLCCELECNAEQAVPGSLPPSACRTYPMLLLPVPYATLTAAKDSSTVENVNSAVIDNLTEVFRILQTLKTFNSMAESDLERFKRQQNIVTDESLESTRRMVNMVEESQTAGKYVQV